MIIDHDFHIRKFTSNQWAQEIKEEILQLGGKRRQTNPNTQKKENKQSRQKKSKQNKINTKKHQKRKRKR